MDISKAIEIARRLAGDRLRETYDARVGRTEDEAVGTGMPSEIFVRINGETEATTALFPVGFDISTLEYDAPVRVRKEKNQWVVITTDAVAGVSFWEGAPPGTSFINAPVVLRTSFATLPNASILADLATGYLKVTTSTGVLSSQATPIPVADGGTGATTFTANRILIGNGTSAISTITTGASGTYLRSNGTVGVFATLNMGDAGAGTLVVGRGGTGATTHTANALLVGAGTSAITSISPSTSGNILQSNGTLWQSVAPSFNASVITAGTLAVARGGTGLGTLTANNVILGNGTSTPLFVAPSTSGNVLTSNGTTWVSQAPATSGTVTSVGVSSNDLTVGGSPVTTSGTISVDVPDQFAHTDLSDEGYWLIDSQNSLFDFQNLITPEFKLGLFLGTVGSKLPILNNNVIGKLVFNGYDGSSQVESSIIRASTVDNFSVGDTPSKLEFLTTADGTSAPALALTLNSDKSAVFAGALSGITSLSASGNISSSAGSVSANTTVSAGTTITAGTGLTVTTGNLGVSAGTISASGNISSSTGALSANTTITAGTGITATTGNISASSGNLSASGSVSASSASITGNVTADIFIADTTVGTNTGGIGYNSTNKALNAYTAGIEQYLGGILFRGTANKSVASTATKTSLIPTSGVGTVTLPANFFTVGRMLRYTMRGAVFSANTVDTLQFDLLLGGTSISLSTARARAVTNNRGFLITGELVCYTTGASGTITGGASYVEWHPNYVNFQWATNSGVTVDTTASLTFDITAQWGAGTSGNNISAYTFILEAL